MNKLNTQGYGYYNAIKYREKSSLLTPTELEFFNTLQQVVSSNETIFSKVRQADIIETTHDKSHPHFWIFFKKISQRHVDFVLCDKKTSRPLVVIEINDKTHKRQDRKKRDQELREALKETSIRLIEIPAARSYSTQEVKKLIYANVHYYDEQLKNLNQQIRNRAVNLLPLSPRQSNDKYNHVDKDTEKQQTKQEYMAHATPKKPFASHLTFENPDSRYMPKS